MKIRRRFGPRLQTRFQPVRLQPPENKVLAAFLEPGGGALPSPLPARSRKGQEQRQGGAGGFGDVEGVTFQPDCCSGLARMRG